MAVEAGSSNIFIGGKRGATFDAGAKRERRPDDCLKIASEGIFGDGCKRRPYFAWMSVLKMCVQRRYEKKNAY